MNFKELIEAYKKGEATPEQARLVEEEIEKNKSINDYICAEMEAGSPEPESDTTRKPDKESYKAVKKIMRRTLLKVGAISAVLVLASLLIANFVISPLVASLHYNPAKVLADEASTGLYYPVTQGGLDAMVNSELHMYGRVLSSYYVEDLGYGKYQTQKRMFDSFDQEYEDSLGKKVDNRLWLDYRTSYFTHNGEYDRSNRTFFNGPEELKQLPDTAVVEAAVLFSEEQTLPELIDLMETNTGLFFEWVAIPNTHSEYIESAGDMPDIGFLGFRPFHIPGSYRVPCDCNIGYPYISLPEYIPITPKILELHVTSLLTRYCDYFKLTVRSSVSDQEKDILAWHEDALKAIQDNGVKTYGAVVIGSPQDIASLYDKDIVSGIEIYDMKSSVYENNMNMYR